MESLVTAWQNMTIEQFLISLSILLNIYQNFRIGRLARLYHQVDKLTYGIAIAIQSIPGLDIELIKQSANGDGDHALNRDV